MHYKLRLDLLSRPTFICNTDLFYITDLQALTLGGLTVTRPVPDPLAVLSLDNQINIFEFVL